MKLMVLDGNSILNRAFYGIRLLSTKSGQYTNAVYGFITILNRLLEEDEPDALCVAFDLKAPTFRHLMYDQYKATRTGMPDELASQLEPIKSVLRAMNIPYYEKEGYEADDLIGTIAGICERTGDDCLIVTGDKDSLQLISDKTKVKLVSTRGGQTTSELYDAARFKERYGFQPPLLIDLKALMGDSSDNIPGVAGVGEKTAMDLVRRFGGIDSIYTDLSGLDIRDSVRKKLEDGREMAALSYELATIDKNVPIDFNPSDVTRSEVNRGELYELFLSLEFNKLIDKYGLEPELEQTQVMIDERQTVRLSSLAQARDAIKSLVCEEYVGLAAAPDLSGVAFCSDAVMFYSFTDEFEGDFDGFLRELFSDTPKKSAHGVKELMRALMERGLPCKGFCFDTALAAYILSPTDNSYAIEKLTVSYLGYELPGGTAMGQTYSLFSDSEASAGALTTRAAAVYALTGVLGDRLLESGESKLYREVELPLCRVLASMECEGFLVDRQMLVQFGQTLAARIDELQSGIYEYAGGSFNINSTKMLGELLFVKLGLPTVKKTKTGYSTDIEVLHKLRGLHPVVELIIEYRTQTKLKSTYTDGLLKVIAHDGRIHTSFNMTATATGRLSSTEPNLQNIPVRTELGSEIRRMFVARPGWVLVDADYSQIELRVLAHIADDKAMIDAFYGDEDIHTVTASQVFGVSPDEVTSLMRSRAKAVNFGIVYGISAYSLSEDIGVFPSEAKDYIDSYLYKYEGVKSYMDRVVSEAKENGYVSTLFGRRRYLPELHSSNFNIRSGAERIALNTPIQGTAADIIKLAMIRVFRRLEEEKLEARLILQVHDELIVEAPEHEARRAAEILTDEMQRVVQLSVPLVAEAKMGKSWYDAK